MTKAEFLDKLQEIFETDNKLSEDMFLNDIEGWDSLAMMAVMAFFYEVLSIPLLPSETREMITVGDLVKKAGL